MCFEEPSLCRKLVFRAQKCNNQIKKWFRSGGVVFVVEYIVSAITCLPDAEYVSAV